MAKKTQAEQAHEGFKKAVDYYGHAGIVVILAVQLKRTLGGMALGYRLLRALKGVKRG